MNKLYYKCRRGSKGNCCRRNLLRKYAPCRPKKIVRPSCTKSERKNRRNQIKICNRKGGKIVAWRKRQMVRACLIKLNRTLRRQRCPSARIPPRIPKPTATSPCKKIVGNYNSYVGKCKTNNVYSSKYRQCYNRARKLYNNIRRKRCGVRFTLPKPKRRTCTPKCNRRWIISYNKQVKSCQKLWKNSNASTYWSYRNCVKRMNSRYTILKRKKCNVRKPRFRTPKPKKITPPKPKCTKRIRKNYMSKFNACNAKWSTSNRSNYTKYRQCYKNVMRLRRKYIINKSCRLPALRKPKRKWTPPKKTCKKSWVSSYNRQVRVCKRRWKTSDKKNFWAYRRCTKSLNAKFRTLKSKKCPVVRPRFKNPKNKATPPPKPKCTKRIRASYMTKYNNCKKWYPKSNRQTRSKYIKCRSDVHSLRRRLYTKKSCKRLPTLRKPKRKWTPPKKTCKKSWIKNLDARITSCTKKYPTSDKATYWPYRRCIKSVTNRAKYLKNKKKCNIQIPEFTTPKPKKITPPKPKCTKRIRKNYMSKFNACNAKWSTSNRSNYTKYRQCYRTVMRKRRSLKINKSCRLPALRKPKRKWTPPKKTCKKSWVSSYNRQVRVCKRRWKTSDKKNFWAYRRCTKSLNAKFRTLKSKKCPVVRPRFKNPKNKATPPPKPKCTKRIRASYMTKYNNCKKWYPKSNRQTRSKYIKCRSNVHSLRRRLYTKKSCKRLPTLRKPKRKWTPPKKTCKKSWVSSYNRQVRVCKRRWKTSDKKNFWAYRRCTKSLNAKFRTLKSKKCPVVRPRFKNPKNKATPPPKPKCTKRIRASYMTKYNNCKKWYPKSNRQTRSKYIKCRSDVHSLRRRLYTKKSCKRLPTLRKPKRKWTPPKKTCKKSWIKNLDARITSCTKKYPTSDKATYWPYRRCIKSVTNRAKYLKNKKKCNIQIPEFTTPKPKKITPPKPKCTKRIRKNYMSKFNACNAKWSTSNRSNYTKYRQCYRTVMRKRRSLKINKSCRLPALRKPKRKWTPPKKTCKKSWVSSYNRQVRVCKRRWKTSDKKNFWAYRRCTKSLNAKFRTLKSKKCPVVRPRFKNPKNKATPPPKPKCTKRIRASYMTKYNNCKKWYPKSNRQTRSKYIKCRSNVHSLRRRLYTKKSCKRLPTLRKPKRKWTPPKKTCNIKQYRKIKSNCVKKANRYLANKKIAAKWAEWWKWRVTSSCYAKLNKRPISKKCKKFIRIGRGPKKPVNNPPKKTCRNSTWAKKIANCNNLWKKKSKLVRVANMKLFKWRTTVGCYNRSLKTLKRRWNFAKCPMPRYPKRPANTPTCKKAAWRRAIRTCRQLRNKLTPPAGSNAKIWLWQKTVRCLRNKVDPTYKKLCGRAPTPSKPRNTCPRKIAKYWRSVKNCRRYKNATWGRAWNVYGRCLRNVNNLYTRINKTCPFNGASLPARKPKKKPTTPVKPPKKNCGKKR